MGILLLHLGKGGEDTTMCLFCCTLFLAAILRPTRPPLENTWHLFPLYSEYGKCSCHWAFYPVNSSQAFWVLDSVLCSQVTEVLVHTASFHHTEFPDNPASEGCVSLSLPAPNKGHTQQRWWPSHPLFLVSKSHSSLSVTTLFRGSLLLAVAHC